MFRDAAGRRAPFAPQSRCENFALSCEQFPIVRRLLQAMFECPVATGYTKPRCLPTITRTLGNRPAKSARRGFGCPKKTRTVGQPTSKRSSRITIIGYLWPDGSCVCSFPDSMPVREPFFQIGSGTKIHKPSGPRALFDHRMAGGDAFGQERPSGATQEVPGDLPGDVRSVVLHPVRTRQ